jgi:hypothetical protein
MGEKPYNPLDKTSLASSIAQAMLSRRVEPLPPGNAFVGAGIYAIYYKGSNKLYAPLIQANRRNFNWPIYVGKASAKSRRGSLSLESDPGDVLFKRLREHAKSIDQATNLDIDDFKCRYLVVDDIWVPLGETLLLQKFSPLWNHVIDGFGNHDPGGGRRVQARSSWDELHPGRTWATKQGASRKQKAEIERKVREYFSTRRTRV